MCCTFEAARVEPECPSVTTTAELRPPGDGEAHGAAGRMEINQTALTGHYFAFESLIHARLE